MIMVTRIPANWEVTVAKLLQRLTSRQMGQQLHIVRRLRTNTARLHLTLPQVSIVHHLILPHRDSTAARRMAKEGIRTLHTEVVCPRQIMDIAQLHTNMVSNLALDRLQRYQIADVNSSTTTSIHISSSPSISSIVWKPSTTIPATSHVQPTVPTLLISGHAASISWPTFVYQSGAYAAAWSARRSNGISRWKLVIVLSQGHQLADSATRLIVQLCLLIIPPLLSVEPA
ncbi:hypothetical protein GGR55DRAFT_204081 [Xylaria sp. FL0064]|nr:hypothetical protein GGR55DRAFT_204081 [Xylaria sp. FL0064]